MGGQNVLGCGSASLRRQPARVRSGDRTVGVHRRRRIPTAGAPAPHQEMKRGEIYWCDLEPRRGHEQGARRPVVIISADQYNASQSPLIGVVPLTTTPV